MKPQLAGNRDLGGLGVVLVGEALGADEAEAGAPFVGRAGFRLTRLLEWAGIRRDQVSILNTVWCRPPDNKLSGEAYETGAIDHCRRAHWGHLLEGGHDVAVPLGGVATAALLGPGPGILKRRGYVEPVRGTTLHAIPTVHPSFIQRGQAKWSAAFIQDVQKAVQLAGFGLPFVVNDFTLDPGPMEALAWARDHLARLARDPRLRLAYDIETPGKGDDEDEVDQDDDPTYTIHRIGFADGPDRALSVPFEPPYFAAIRALVESSGEKVVWNAGFDNPRLAAAGFGVRGLIHDGMVAWHVLHSDLPKSLGFVATFTCPWQPPWKHLSQRSPAFYNATDAAVEWESMRVIEADLREAGMWETYERDVVRLEPLLAHMHNVGMPMDLEVRLDRAIKLGERKREIKRAMQEAVPPSLKRVHPPAGFVRPPSDTSLLVPIRVDLEVRRCDRCGQVGPRKDHFRTLKRPTASRPQNPCGGAGVVVNVESVERYAAPVEWVPSRVNLIAYNEALGRVTPTKWDKAAGKRKLTMDEKAIHVMLKAHPDDPLYPLVLDYRVVEKIAGTYIGEVISDGGVQEG